MEGRGAFGIGERDDHGRSRHGRGPARPCPGATTTTNPASDPPSPWGVPPSHPSRRRPTANREASCAPRPQLRPRRCRAPPPDRPPSRRPGHPGKRWRASGGAWYLRSSTGSWSGSSPPPSATCSAWKGPRRPQQAATGSTPARGNWPLHPGRAGLLHLLPRHQRRTVDRQQDPRDSGAGRRHRPLPAICPGVRPGAHEQPLGAPVLPRVLLDAVEPRKRTWHDMVANSLVVRANVYPPGEFGRPAH